MCCILHSIPAPSSPKLGLQWLVAIIDDVDVSYLKPCVNSYWNNPTLIKEKMANWLTRLESQCGHTWSWACMTQHSASRQPSLKTASNKNHSIFIISQLDQNWENFQLSPNAATTNSDCGSPLSFQRWSFPVCWQPVQVLPPAAARTEQDRGVFKYPHFY